MDVDRLKRSLRKQKRTPKNLRPENLLSTSSTLLNLLSTGKACGGIPKGKYILLAGDSDAGKTVLAMSILAEAARDPRFSDYDLVHDNAESGVPMEAIVRAIRRKAGKRYQAPATDKAGLPVHSSNIQEFYYHLDDRFATGRPFIYLLDSMDGLDDEAEEKKAKKQKKAYREGGKEAGSFGAGKAKTNSMKLRGVQAKLRKTGSILIIIAQLRDNLGFTMGAEKRSRSGGRAIKFYARLEVWLSAKKQLHKTVRGKARHIGVLCQVKVKKNHFTGIKGQVEIPIYTDYGVDDIGSCIDYLMSEGHWKKAGMKLKAPEFKFIGMRDKLVQQIEDKGLESKLGDIVQKVWTEIREATQLKRKPRYG